MCVTHVYMEKLFCYKNWLVYRIKQQKTSWLLFIPGKNGNDKICDRAEIEKIWKKI